jgi:hypothetical protein
MDLLYWSAVDMNGCDDSFKNPEVICLTICLPKTREKALLVVVVAVANRP